MTMKKRRAPSCFPRPLDGAGWGGGETAHRVELENCICNDAEPPAKAPHPSPPPQAWGAGINEMTAPLLVSPAPTEGGRGLVRVGRGWFPIRGQPDSLARHPSIRYAGFFTGNSMREPLRRRTGGQILIDQVKIHGVDLAFGVPG